MTETGTRSDRRPDPVAELIEFKPYQGGYACRFDFDPFLVALIKKQPRADRTYHAEHRFWWLTEERARFVGEVARECGYTVDGAP